MTKLELITRKGLSLTANSYQLRIEKLLKGFIDNVDVWLKMDVRGGLRAVVIVNCYGPTFFAVDEKIVSLTNVSK
jgi:hypothetical protein